MIFIKIAEAIIYRNNGIFVVTLWLVTVQREAIRQLGRGMEVHELFLRKREKRPGLSNLYFTNNCVVHLCSVPH